MRLTGSWASERRGWADDAIHACLDAADGEVSERLHVLRQSVGYKRSTIDVRAARPHLNCQGRLR